MRVRASAASSASGWMRPDATSSFARSIAGANSGSDRRPASVAIAQSTIAAITQASQTLTPSRESASQTPKMITPSEPHDHGDVADGEQTAGARDLLRASPFASPRRSRPRSRTIAADERERAQQVQCEEPVVQFHRARGYVSQAPGFQTISATTATTATSIEALSARLSGSCKRRASSALARHPRRRDARRAPGSACPAARRSRRRRASSRAARRSASARSRTVEIPRSLGEPEAGRDRERRGRPRRPGPTGRTARSSSAISEGRSRRIAASRSTAAASEPPTKRNTPTRWRKRIPSWLIGHATIACRHAHRPSHRPPALGHGLGRRHGRARLRRCAGDPQARGRGAGDGDAGARSALAAARLERDGRRDPLGPLAHGPARRLQPARALDGLRPHADRQVGARRLPRARRPHPRLRARAAAPAGAAGRGAPGPGHAPPADHGRLVQLLAHDRRADPRRVVLGTWTERGTTPPATSRS